MKLTFEVKRNLKKPPRIHVKSLSKNIIYGSFAADEPEKFDGLDKMNNGEVIEFNHYINNLNAVKNHLGVHSLNEQSDYRLRIPLNFAEIIDEISMICYQSSNPLNIFEPIVSSIIQELKISVAKLKGDKKIKALTLLDKIGLSEYKKMDYSRQIQSIFSELLSVHNKSEKLHTKSKMFFHKDKSYSPKAIENMGTGEITPSKWLVTCAIAVLLDEKPTILKNILSDDDLFMLFAKQLLDNKGEEILTKLVKKYQLHFLEKRINDYSVIQ